MRHTRIRPYQRHTWRWGMLVLEGAMVSGLCMTSALAQQMAPLTQPASSSSIEQMVVPAPTQPVTDVAVRATMPPARKELATPAAPASTPSAIDRGEPRADRVPTIQWLPENEPQRGAAADEALQTHFSDDISPPAEPHPWMKISF